jgi:predicted secreted Zn-dependent protease
MLNLLVAMAAATAQAGYGAPPPTGQSTPHASLPPANPAVPAAGRGLKDLPGVTVKHYDVAGKDGKAIEKSLKKILAAADPSTGSGRVFDWNVEANVTKLTVGTTCTIKSVDATLTGNVYLPRLTEEARVPREVLDSWRPYVAGLEKMGAANLWFVNDKLPAIQKSMVGLPCDSVGGAWDTAMAKLRQESAAYSKQLEAAEPKK